MPRAGAYGAQEGRNGPLTARFGRFGASKTPHAGNPARDTRQIEIPDEPVQCTTFAGPEVPRTSPKDAEIGQNGPITARFGRFGASRTPQTGNSARDTRQIEILDEPIHCTTFAGPEAPRTGPKDAEIGQNGPITARFGRFGAFGTP